MVSEVPEVARNWWLFVVLGLVCAVTGILAIFTIVLGFKLRSLPNEATAPAQQTATFA